MASGTEQHQHQYQPQQPQHQQSSRQEHPMLQQQQKNQMQLATNQGLNACLDSQQPIHHMNDMSPGSMAIDPRQGHMMNMSPYNQQPPPPPAQQQQQNTIISPVMQPAVLSRDMCNQPTNQHHGAPQLLPTLLSPQSTGPDPLEQTTPSQNPESDHDQIIDQVISLENDFSDPSAMTNVDNNMGMAVSTQAPLQQQLHHMGDTNFTSGPCMSGANQLSSSSEDLLNLLLEFDRDTTSMVSGQQLDQDEKTGIETIRKQLMSCEMQSDHLQHDNSISPTLKQISNSGHPQQVEGATQQPRAHQIYHGVEQQHQLISRTAPIMSHNQQQQPPQHQLSTPGLSQQRQQSQHHRLSVDQTLLQGSYANARLSNAVPVSSSGHSYDSEIMSTISQSTPISIYNNSPSPSPSWQQPQLSPFSPPTPNNTARPPPQRQQHHPTHLIESQQQHPTAKTASSHIQHQLHHPLQRKSPSQSLSPTANNDPSPVVKKNPLLNAQLVNSRAPSLTPNRFANSQTSVLNQNPILNSKLSQSTFVTSNSCNSITSSSNPNLNRQPQQHRYIQQQSPHQQQQSSSFSYDISQQQNAQQQTPPQTGYVPMYGQGDIQQQPNQIYRASNTSNTASSCMQSGGSPQMSMSSTSPSGGGLSQQVKQEIRKKVQQPKQQHQTTSLLKQLLSDDNK